MVKHPRRAVARPPTGGHRGRSGVVHDLGRVRAGDGDVLDQANDRFDEVLQVRDFSAPAGWMRSELEKVSNEGL